MKMNVDEGWAHEESGGVDHAPCLSVDPAFDADNPSAVDSDVEAGATVRQGGVANDQVAVHELLRSAEGVTKGDTRDGRCWNGTSLVCLALGRRCLDVEFAHISRLFGQHRGGAVSISLLKEGPDGLVM